MPGQVECKVLRRHSGFHQPCLDGINPLQSPFHPGLGAGDTNIIPHGFLKIVAQRVNVARAFAQRQLQSLDLREVVREKAGEAWRRLGRPVLVEDTSLELDALGHCGKWGQSVPSSGGSHYFLVLDPDPTVKLGGS